MEREPGARPLLDRAGEAVVVGVGVREEHAANVAHRGVELRKSCLERCQRRAAPSPQINEHEPVVDSEGV